MHQIQIDSHLKATVVAASILNSQSWTSDGHIKATVAATSILNPEVVDL